MTKADVLNTFPKIEAGVKYNFKGSSIEYVPFEASYEKLEPIFKESEGWQSDISKVTGSDNVPIQLANYIKFVEEETGLPVAMVSVGPDRKQIINL